MIIYKMIIIYIVIFHMCIYIYMYRYLYIIECKCIILLFLYGSYPQHRCLGPACASGKRLHNELERSTHF